MFGDNKMVIELNKDNFDTEVNKEGIPIIVDFFADWCGPCQMMKPEFEALSKEMEGTLRFGKINTDDAPDIAGKFNINGIPCLIVIKEGKEIDRIVGFATKDLLKEKIEKILEKV